MHCKQRSHFTGLGTSSHTSPAFFMGVRARSKGISTLETRCAQWKGEGGRKKLGVKVNVIFDRTWSSQHLQTVSRFTVTSFCGHQSLALMRQTDFQMIFRGLFCAPFLAGPRICHPRVFGASPHPRPYGAARETQSSSLDFVVGSEWVSGQSSTVSGGN